MELVNSVPKIEPEKFEEMLNTNMKVRCSAVTRALFFSPQVNTDDEFCLHSNDFKIDTCRFLAVR